MRQKPKAGCHVGWKGSRRSQTFSLSPAAPKTARLALVGWSDAGTRPPFDLVTGVSSGALIAPFAFLGREHDRQLREIFTKYGRKDVFTYNVHGLLEGSSLTDDAPLAKLIETYVDDAFIQE